MVIYVYSFHAFSREEMASGLKSLKWIFTALSVPYKVLYFDF
jgi:hypothetical protein